MNNEINVKQKSVRMKYYMSKRVMTRYIQLKMLILTIKRSKIEKSENFLPTVNDIYHY